MPRAEKDSNFRRIRKEAIAQGWVVMRTRNNRFSFTPPGEGSPVVFSGSPGEWRSLRNFIAELRKRGFQPPSKLKGKR